jgi:hypothetical protein
VYFANWISKRLTIMLIEVFCWGEMMYLIFHCISAVCFSVLVNNTPPFLLVVLVA